MSPWIYCCSFILPAMAAVGLLAGGLWAWLTPAFVFLMIPIVDALLGCDESSSSKISHFADSGVGAKLYTSILLVQVVLQIALLLLLGHVWNQVETPWLIRIGWMLSVALSVGGVGITVAHELIHRQDFMQRMFGKSMLMGVLYMHFSIEHVRGHHARVATDHDPASAPLGMSVYRFLATTIPAQWFSAWELESKRLEKHQLWTWSIQNEMLWFIVIELLWLLGLLWAFGLSFLPIYLVVAVVSCGLLEIVNYIEHYGLRREINETNGRHEAVGPEHSWNSNHRLSRALLFELSRHSDHHMHAIKPYQRLENETSSPQLPNGYPGMVLLTLLPPIWFRVMDCRISKSQ